MKYLDQHAPQAAGEDALETQASVAAQQMQLQALQDRLREMPPTGDALARAQIELDIARAHIALEQGAEAWETARRAFDRFIAAGQWEPAAECCHLLFLADQPGSLSALGQGIWLAVTYPVDPELTVALLQHVIDETPDESDGAAVAATAAAYVVDLRAQGKQHDDLMFFANQMLGVVARRHGNVEDQAQFQDWLKRLELHDPAAFLPRLRNVVDVLVQDDWWIDRDALRAKLPVH